MKYFFYIILSWTVGFVLPTLSPVLQIALAGLFLGLLAAGLFYYIDTRINSIRIR